MSTNDTKTPPTDPKREDVEATVEANRELFERLAASDLPVAEDYQHLLDYVDEGDDTDA